MAHGIGGHPGKISPIVELSLSLVKDYSWMLLAVSVNRMLEKDVFVFR
jgi:hypothetical protein